jgi:Tol biopolymer transport system component
MDLWRQRLRSDGSADGPADALTVALGLHGRAVFAPDGSKIAYARGRLVANLWRVPVLVDRRASWADATPLTSEQAFIDSVDVCRKARRLAFSSDRAGSLDLWVMPADGGVPQQRTTYPASEWGPAWSPDCREIAFHSDRSGNRDIWVVPVEPGPARQLTRRPENELDPRWSPDGRTLVFSSGPQPGQTWRIAAEGGEPVALIEAGDRPDDWSPDGRWILYTNATDGRRWRWAVDGGKNESLSFESRVARWDPDGRHIYYLSPTEDDILAYGIEDGRTRRITELKGRPGKLGPYALATDGTHVYFAWRLDESDIWVMDAVFR